MRVYYSHFQVDRWEQQRGCAMTLKCGALAFKIKLPQLETVVIAVLLQMTLGQGTVTLVVYTYCCSCL